MKKAGYKLTPLGWIPSDWTVKELKDITSRSIVYGIVQAGPHVADGIPYIKSSDVGGEIDINSLCRTSFTIANKYKRSGIEPGDIVFSLRGNIGELSIVPEGLKHGNLTQGTARISVLQEDIKYIKYALSGPTLKKVIIIKAKGSTFQEISLEQLRQLPIPLPSLPEQRCIAAILSTWDAVIGKEQQLIAALRARHRALMQQLLSGKKRLKGFTGKWWEVTYGSLLKEVIRPISWNDHEIYKLISVRRRSGGIFSREALFGHQIKVKDLRTANTGDFLFSKMQILHGASALVTDEFDGAKISGSYIAVVARDPKKLNIHYFNFYSRLPYFYHQTYVSSFGVHIEKMTFDFDAFLSLQMSLPSSEEQAAIVAVLRTSEHEIQTHRRRIAAVKQQKNGLMQVLLTGKVRVKTAER